MTRRIGLHRRPIFPKLSYGQVAITWIGHASFLIQFTDLNVLIDPNFANWLFLLKRIKRSGLKIRDLPRIDLVLLTHAHFDHFHKPTLRRLPHPKIGVMPRGVGDLAQNLGFARIIELEWWETFFAAQLEGHFHAQPALGGAHFARSPSRLRRVRAGASRPEEFITRVTAPILTASRTSGEGFTPEIALLPIGAYHPESFRRVHMGPDEAMQAFQDLRARWLVPMHYGTFKLSFEELDEPPRWLREIAARKNLTQKVRMLDEGVPMVF